MAIDSIGGKSSNSLTATQRAQNAAAPANLRNSPAVLNAIVQTPQKNSGATSIVKAFAVPQTSKSGNSTVKLPRGSLVDVLT